MTGVGVASLLLYRALMRHPSGHRFVGLFLDRGGFVPETSALFEYKHTSVDYESHPLGDWWMNVTLPKRVLGAGADLYHGPGFYIPWRKTPFPKVVTIHDLIAFTYPDTYPMAFREFIKWATRFSVRAAARVIVPSGKTKSDLEDIFKIDPSKVDVVPHYALSCFKPLLPDEKRSFRKSLRLPGKYILNVGTLEPRKNQVTLIRAFEIFKRRVNTDHKLAIVGGTNSRSRDIVKAITESPVATDIIHFAPCGPREIAPIFACSDIFVFPSLYEGFGLPLLEAMQCGIPVVASNTTSVPEVVGEAGFLVPPDSPEELAEAMLSLVTSGEAMREMKEKGFQRAALFNARRTASLTLSSYEKALGGNPEL